MAFTGNSLYGRLFIIDDDVEDQEIFIEALKEVDASVECYSSTSGEDAIALLESQLPSKPDLIFLDLNMPKLNGKQILRELKNKRVLRDIPVIMYSTSFAPKDVDEIQSIGAVYHLLKPSRFEELCKALGYILTERWPKL